MLDHGARAHATWAASSSGANIRCAGRIALTGIAPPEKESIHAARGTACHQLAENCLRGALRPVAFLGKIENTKETPIEIDEELVNSATTYVDYVSERFAEATAGGGRTWLEQRFTLAAINPPFDSGGTGDAVAWFPAQRRIEVIDLKNGRGVVDVVGNNQLRTYALGAVLANPDLPVEQITVTIVQPNAPVDGRAIRSETFHVADLLEWTVDLLAAMHRARQAQEEFKAVTDEPQMREWSGKWLNTGACTFCPAAGFCSKFQDEAKAVAEVWFDGETGNAELRNTLFGLTPEKLAADLELLDMLEEWISARRSYAHHQAESGVVIPGYQLVERYGHRKWGADEEKVRKDLILVAGLAEDEVYAPRKLKSPAMVEKTLGTKRQSVIASMWIKPVTGKTLVRTADTDRPPVLSRLETYFEPLLEKA